MISSESLRTLDEFYKGLSKDDSHKSLCQKSINDLEGGAP